METLKKVAKLLTLGKEIENSMPELQQVSFIIDNASKESVEKVSYDYNGILIPPSITHQHYRTTVLDGSVKIVVRSPRYLVTYQITEP